VNINSGDGVLNAPTDGDSPLIKELTLTQLPGLVNEYGYGFWMRYLTHFPVRMWAGKNAAWY
jgi:hypothetical protein